MRKAFRVCALVLVLASSTYAGDMQFPVAPPPPSAPTLAQIVLTLFSLF